MVILHLFFLFVTSDAFSPLTARLHTRADARSLHKRFGGRAISAPQRARVARNAPERSSNHVRMGLLSWLDSKLEERRRKRSFDRRPDRIILIRHGESEGNTDQNAYSKTPDSKIALTEKGRAQGAIAGAHLRELTGNDTVRFFYSPYMRTQQTLLEILKAFDGQTVDITAEPRVREQDFGNFQNPEAMDNVFKERQQFGRFYYRFMNGEAGTDVFDRTASFLTYLFRTMQKGEAGQVYGDDGDPAKNYVIVTHGLLMRIFCMCYLRWTVQEFEQVWNPSNCGIWVLQKIPDQGTYELAGRWVASPEGYSFEEIKYGKDKNQPLHAHMKRPIVSRLLTPGAPGALDSVELAHLRDIPGPDEAPSRSRALKDVDKILKYWLKDEKISSKAGQNRP